MATTQDAFLELLRRIELNPTRISLASQRYNSVKSLIAAQIPGATVRQIGSFQRQTKIRPLDLTDGLDVDALVQLGEARQYAPLGQGIGPAEAVQKVLKALQNHGTYGVMEPAADAPAVLLNYADGFTMELVPGYAELTGKYSRPEGPPCYIVPGHGAREWSPADYDFDAAAVTTLNQSRACAGMLVPSIKLVKDVLRNWKVGLKSFHVEILVALILPDSMKTWAAANKTWGYHHLVADFLSTAGGLLQGPVMLPGSYSLAVDSRLLLPELQRIGVYLSRQGTVAWELCKIDNIDQACRKWADFWGEPFPPASALL